MQKRAGEIEKRKNEHLKLALSEKSQIGDAGFGRYKFVHNALPEIDFDKIDISTIFPARAGRLGKSIDYPFFISCMTGGINDGAKINRNLARVAQKHNIAMGVGSQRAAIEHKNLKKMFEVRKYAPDIPVIANIGLVQINYGYGISEFQKCVDMIKADALAVHINPIQEVIQPEGDRNFESLLPKLAKIVKKLSVPVIVKEVGFGLSGDVVRRLYGVGVRIFDTAGRGGTNWVWIEEKRAFSKSTSKSVSAKVKTPGLNSFNPAGCLGLNLADIFTDWGISTTDSIKACEQFRIKIKPKKARDEIVILGSGGVRTGVDIAKAIALGADLVGIAMPFAGAATVSSREVGKLVERLSLELKIAMFGVGAANIPQLKKIKLPPISF